MKKGALVFLFISSLVFKFPDALGQQQVLDPAWRHVRNNGPREWSEFPERAALSSLRIPFRANSNATEFALSLRQYDVKLRWRVMLNGEPLGHLAEDEKDLITYVRIPARRLRGENVLEIKSDDEQGDDIRIGEITLYSTAVDSLLSEAQLDLRIVDKTSGLPVPCRLTVVNARGILQTVLAPEGETLAVRPGHVYTASGTARFGVPRG